MVRVPEKVYDSIGQPNEEQTVPTSRIIAEYNKRKNKEMNS